MLWRSGTRWRKLHQAASPSIRGGGHNAVSNGRGLGDDGLVIDLAPINLARRSILPRELSWWVRAANGVHVDHATHALLSCSPPESSRARVAAGLTLGGGMGHLTRKYGLTIVIICSVDMVLADGAGFWARQTPRSYADLFKGAQARWRCGTLGIVDVVLV